MKIGLSWSCSPGALLVMLTCAAQGCSTSVKGPPRGAVTGTVRLDENPIADGHISFFPIKGTTGPVVGAVISSGGYAISESQGPVAGWNRVEISFTRKTGRSVPAGSPYPPGTMVDEIVEGIPARYNSQSTLTAEIKAGENELNFDLKSK